MEKREKVILFFLLFILLAIRLYHLNVWPLENEESWRQADTESIARNFVVYDFNIFHPNFNYDGPLPNIPALEIQITTYLIAMLYKVFGTHYFLARIVPIIFFLASAWFLYRFARIHMGLRGAAFSLIIYGILPINVYYSRAIMPESAAMMFWIGGFYFFNRWFIDPQKGWLVFSSLFLSLAIMTKPPVVFVAIPMIYLCIKNYGWKWLKMAKLWAFALITLTLPACYYYYSSAIAEFKYAVGIPKHYFMNGVLTTFYSPEARIFLAENIPKMMGLICFLLVLTGIFVVSRKQTVILVWFLAMSLEVILIVCAIRASYYLIFFMVPCSLLAGILLDQISRFSIGKVVVVVLLTAILIESYHQVKPMFIINTVMQDQVITVLQLTEKDDLLVVGSLDPCLLSLTGRRGWRYNLRLYSYTPKDPLKELDYYIVHGAKYFVPIQGKIFGDKDGRLLSYIKEKYQQKEVIPGYPIFVLQ